MRAKKDIPKKYPDMSGADHIEEVFSNSCTQQKETTNFASSKNGSCSREEESVVDKKM